MPGTGVPPGERIFVGVGANLGNPRTAVETAMRRLDEWPGISVVARSSLYRSAPLEASGPDFVNSVVELRSTLPPIRLLDALQALEHEQGRERPYRHAPRTLDLDLLLFGARVLHLPRLTLPHPHMQHRAFVLVPLLEIDDALAHPLVGPLARWLPALADQSVSKLS
jgi:2-amino-4-hydroxy-6-hydroxymethyldihydropteridine diphosphokinase